MTHQESRFVQVMLLLDANAINARQADPDLNQIEKWNNDGVVRIIMSAESSSEARAGGNATRAAKVAGHIFSYVGAGTGDEHATKQAIADILCPSGARTDSERNDIEIVFHAQKYGATLVTNDGASRRQPGGILGNRQKLQSLGVSVMRPSEVVGAVRARIDARDDRARQAAAWKSIPVPSWVGRD
jgi:hypothetical protein